MTFPLNSNRDGCRALALLVLLLFSLQYGDSTAFSMNSNNNNNAMEKKISRLDRTVRGNQYGTLNNSTIPTAEQAALAVGVRPPLDASARVWKRAWKFHRAAMPWLHWRDSATPPDSSLSLMCLWWKALAANHRKSPAYDDGLTHDLLPSKTRFVVSRKLRRFFPRLHHANVEIRTAFLDQAVQKVVDTIADSKTIRLVTLGGGYDARSIKLRTRGTIDAAIELDLPQVVQAKQVLYKRIQKRRPTITPELLPTLVEVDLNNLTRVEEILTDIVADNDNWHTIFLFEGVMIYLDEGVPHGLLEVCSKVLLSSNKENADGSLVFADRLERIPGGDQDIGVQVLQEAGWKVVEWQPKPGLARHMGAAELITSKQ